MITTMNRMMFPAILGLLLACNGGKQPTVEGVPDVVTAETPAAEDAVTDGVTEAEAAPVAGRP